MKLFFKKIMLLSCAAGLLSSVLAQNPDNPAPAPIPAPAPTPAPAPVPPPVPEASVSLTRIEKREIKRQDFENKLDSLVVSRNFRFLPNSMQEVPSGSEQLIYNMLYFIAVFSDHVEVHIPTIRGGVVRYIEMLNFDTFDISDYKSSKLQYYWYISFCMKTSDNQKYVVSLRVNTLTGESILTLLSASASVRYVGYIQSLTKD